MPVRALQVYIGCLYRLLGCLSTFCPALRVLHGRVVSKKRLSHWIVETLSLWLMRARERNAISTSELIRRGLLALLKAEVGLKARLFGI